MDFPREDNSVKSESSTGRSPSWTATGLSGRVAVQEKGLSVEHSDYNSVNVYITLGLSQTISNIKRYYYNKVL